MCRARSIALLEIDRAVAERCLRLAHRAVERARQSVRRVDQPHPASAAAQRGLDEQRIAERRGGRTRRCRVAHRLGGLEHGNPGAAGNLTRARLVAGNPEHGRRRADEAHAGRVTAAREHRVLGHEAIAGIDRVGADGDRQIDDQLRIEIGADRVPGSPIS